MDLPIPSSPVFPVTFPTQAFQPQAGLLVKLLLLPVHLLDYLLLLMEWKEAILEFSHSFQPFQLLTAQHKMKEKAVEKYI